MTRAMVVVFAVAMGCGGERAGGMADAGADSAMHADADTGQGSDAAVSADAAADGAIDGSADAGPPDAASARPTACVNHIEEYLRRLRDDHAAVRLVCVEDCQFCRFDGEQPCDCRVDSDCPTPTPGQVQASGFLRSGGCVGNACVTIWEASPACW